MTESYFLTVDWCSKGTRGIFCDRKGMSPWKDGEPHTREEMWDILGPFFMILSPESRPFTDEEVAEFTYFRPLAEYKGEYGIALKEESVPIKEIGRLGGGSGDKG